MEASRWATSPTDSAPALKSKFTLNPNAPAYNFSPSPAPTTAAAAPPPPAAPSQLSAYAPQFQPPQEDEFASQTRTQDDLDLFDDDFEPIPEPPPQVNVPSVPRIDRGGRNGRGRGRGRGAHHDTTRALPPTTNTNTSTDTNIDPSPTAATSPPDPKPSTDPSSASPEIPTTAPPTTTTLPPRPAPVRGDRTLTGGLRKPKLTPTELTARMEAMALKSAARAAEHERAIADEASFREREVQAAEKRREEVRNRVQMDKERERNAARKLKAMAGREWEVGKVVEEGAGRGRGGGLRRGAFGDVVGGVGESRTGEDSAVEGYEYPEGRGRGGRGRGRGGSYDGRGRGGASGRGRVQQHSNPTSFNATSEDFPALGPTTSAQPIPAAPATTTTTTQNPADQNKTAQSEWAKPSSSDWADEMAQPVEASDVKW